MMTRWLCLSLSLAVWLGADVASFAQEKDITIEGQLKVGVHKFKLDNAYLYQFEVKGKNFEPSVNLHGHFIPNTVQFGKERYTFRASFGPPKSGEFTLAIGTNIGAVLPEGLLDYTVTLKAMKVDETPLLKKEDKITADDPKYQASFRKTGFKAYPVNLKSGQTYIIDMVRTGGMGNRLDPYLYLEDDQKKIVNQNDDGGGYPHARIIYTATTDGEFRVIAAGLSDMSGIGDYTLTVRSVKSQK